MKCFITSTLAVAASLAHVGYAEKLPPQIPTNGQIGALDFPVVCKVPILGNIAFDFYGTATAPVNVASGQQMYYTDFAAALKIPKLFTQLGSFIGGTQASALVYANLRLKNTSPAMFAVFPNGLLLENITFPTKGEILDVHVPRDGVLPPMGPVTAGQPNQESILFLDSVNITINVQNAKGQNVFFPLPVTCGAQPIDWELGVVNVGPANGGPPLKVQTGEKNTFKNISLGYQTGSYRFPYECEFEGPLGKQDIDLSLTGTVKAFFAPGETFSITDAEAFVRLPPSFVAAAVKAYPGLVTFEVSTSSFTIGATNASPSTINALAAGPVVSKQQVVNDKEVVLAIPQDGVLTIGPMKAGDDGTTLVLSAGNTTSSIRLLGANSNVLGTPKVSCYPKAGSDLIGITVTKTKPPTPLK
ncbi:hypothetical protein QQS21_003388 [Conoideocrella luteorostrata]|uniref:Uncharacterized protein n=1 Tax=Conoideocrella luteorostrata TaxID=1105319 RepID=A0AAJ0CTD6_9HYPO|nr:hypothetical protein QQS21_003388 [Conoideocrella luteorostrata]